MYMGGALSAFCNQHVRILARFGTERWNGFSSLTTDLFIRKESWNAAGGGQLVT